VITIAIVELFAMLRIKRIDQERCSAWPELEDQHGSAGLNGCCLLIEIRKRIGALQMKVITNFLLAGTLLAFGATAIAQDDSLETTFDGLVKIEKSNFKLAWADPDVDFSAYNKYISGGGEFQFRAVKKTSSTVARSRNQSEFHISAKNKQKLADTVSEVFKEELAKSKSFTETDAPGADTLIIRGMLHDIVSQVPPDLMGRGQIYLSSVGEATLVIEALDSLSGEVLYRAVDRWAAQRPGGQMVVANTVTTWSEVRRLARLWAGKLRKGMDSIHNE
jgi:hypothetical protein